MRCSPPTHTEDWRSLGTARTHWCSCGAVPDGCLSHTLWGAVVGRTSALSHAACWTWHSTPHRCERVLLVGSSAPASTAVAPDESSQRL